MMHFLTPSRPVCLGPTKKGCTFSPFIMEDIAQFYNFRAGIFWLLKVSNGLLKKEFFQIFRRVSIKIFFQLLLSNFFQYFSLFKIGTLVFFNQFTPVFLNFFPIFVSWKPFFCIHCAKFYNIWAGILPLTFKGVKWIINACSMCIRPIKACMFFQNALC